MNEYTLSKTYNFHDTEQRIYEWWEKSGYFIPSNDPNKPGFDPAKKPFVISIPPPNVTGELHLGHAMFVSMEDLMIRYHRMKGFSTLWVPGSDHAGIATQLQMEKALAQEGLRREDIGREEFQKRTWVWKEKYGAIHPGRRTITSSAGSFRTALRKRVDIPRPQIDQLVTRLEDSHIRSGGGILRRARYLILFQIRPG
jgi:hypothetical protein